MPAHDSMRRDERQVLAPADAQSTSEDPQQPVPDPKPTAPPASGRPIQHGELMAQEEVLEDELWRGRASACTAVSSSDSSSSIADPAVAWRPERGNGRTVRSG